MRIVIVSDAWHPQVNGVVTVLDELVTDLQALGHQVAVIGPHLFATRPCPGYPQLQLAKPAKGEVAQRLQSQAFDALHVATEGPLGWAARRWALAAKVPFTTAYHTRFPEVLKAAVGLPLWLSYAVFKRFHRAATRTLVPTQHVHAMLAARGFRHLVPWTHGVDTERFAFSDPASNWPGLAHLTRPIALLVGRVSYEKNIDAFLNMSWEGSKVICGEGPLKEGLMKQHPAVTWLGVLPRAELAKVYGAADVFVFPSRHETFGLVMLEAMAAGTPVAAFPVDAAQEVMSCPEGQAPGGVLSDNLAFAAQQALGIEREAARAHALRFGLRAVSTRFVASLVPVA